MLAGAELLDGGLACFSRVGPAAGAGLCPYTTLFRSCGGGLRREIGLALIDVGDGERAAGGEMARPIDRKVLGNGAGHTSADHPPVYGAVDGDRDKLAGAAV